MKASGTRVSRMKDNLTFCLPNAEYGGPLQIEVETNDFDEVATVTGHLPESDERWPKGASLDDAYVRVGDKILKKK